MLDTKSHFSWIEEADVTTRYFAQTDHWVSVCKGPAPRVTNLHHDLALGLGIGLREIDARSRAIGEMMERLGAGLGGLTNASEVAAFDKAQCKVGQVSAKGVFLPWINKHGTAFPATSHGLAYWPSWHGAARRAQSEATERWMLAEIAKGNLSLAFAEKICVGPYIIQLFESNTSPRLRVAVICSSDGIIFAAGADVSDDNRAALREALLAALCRSGYVLPGVFKDEETLLRGFGLTHSDQLLGRSSIEVTVPRFRFALACPDDWASRGHWVVRCLLGEHSDG